MTMLNELMSEAQGYMKDVATGPTRAAFVIEKIENDWNSLKAESDEKKFVTAMTKAFGRKRGAQWFAARRIAVGLLGDAAKKILHHGVAVWASKKIPTADRKKFMEACAAEFVRNNKHPLTDSAARRVALQAGIIASGGRQGCQRCAQLEAELRRLGSDYNEREAAE